MKNDLKEPRKSLQALGLSESEITVYLAMLAGARVANDLVKTTGLKRPTVYYALSCLEKRGLVGKSGSESDKKFVLSPLEHLSVIAQEKALEAKQLEHSIKEIVPALTKEFSPEQHKPVVTFYEGVDAVKGIVMESLYAKRKELCSVAPHKNFFQEVGADFVKLYIDERRRRKIKTKNLWEREIDQRVLEQYYRDLSEVRILPEIMRGTFDSTIFLYDDKTLIISSKAQAYCILIVSKEYHDTMRAWFNGLWSASTPHRHS